MADLIRWNNEDDKWEKLTVEEAINAVKLGNLPAEDYAKQLELEDLEGTVAQNKSELMQLINSIQSGDTTVIGNYQLVFDEVSDTLSIVYTGDD